MNPDNINDYEVKNRLKGFVKVSLMNENVAVLEADEEGLYFLCQFITAEILNDSENEYSFKHFSYLPQIGEDDLAQGSLDFYIEKIDGYIKAPFKEGKSYLQYGISSIVNSINNKDYLIEANSYIKVEQRDNLLVCLSCNKFGFISLCNLLRLMANNGLNEIHLYPKNKQKNLWDELSGDSMELIIAKFTG